MDIDVKHITTYVARTLLSWSRVVSETCPTSVSDTRVICIFKNLSRVRVSCPFSIVAFVQYRSQLYMYSYQCFKSRPIYRYIGRDIGFFFKTRR